MTRAELIACLDRDPRYDYVLEDDGSVLVADLHIGGDDSHPLTRFEPAAIDKLNWPAVCSAAAQGRDVNHITRVTGYFSNTNGWNRGKVAELRDRHRVTVRGENDGR